MPFTKFSNYTALFLLFQGKFIYLKKKTVLPSSERQAYDFRELKREKMERNGI
jgi:hypothetical protein